MRVEGFIIERELGRGGMGIVYSAVHEKTAERVAVKMLSPHLLRDQRHHRRFQREARAAAQVAHAGLVRVFGHGAVADGEPYILMEYLDGSSLRRTLEAAPAHRLSIAAALHIAIQLAEMLAAAHKTGLLHRDIKPSNVMLLGASDQPAACRVKLIDFGLARLLTEGDGVTISEGDVLGTPFYMSPEQCEGRTTLDGRSDVYSLGALLFEMLCGRTPFVGLPPRVMYQHVYESPPPLETLRPEMSLELSVLVMKMLAKAPDSRPTMAEAVTGLRSCADINSAAPRASDSPRAGAPRVPGKAGRWIGILGLINVALLAYLFRAHAPASTAPAPGKGSAPLKLQPASLTAPAQRRGTPVSSTTDGRTEQAPVSPLHHDGGAGPVLDPVPTITKPGAVGRPPHRPAPRSTRRAQPAPTSGASAASPDVAAARNEASASGPSSQAAELPPPPSAAAPSELQAAEPAPSRATVRPRIEYWK